MLLPHLIYAVLGIIWKASGVPSKHCQLPHHQPKESLSLYLPHLPSLVFTSFQKSILTGQSACCTIMRVWIWILGTCGKAGCTSVNPASVGGRGRWGLGAHWPASLPEGVSSRLSADPVPKTKMENDRGPTPTSGFHRTIQACVRLHTQKHTLKRSIPEQLYFFLGENPLCYKKT